MYLNTLVFELLCKKIYGTNLLILKLFIPILISKSSYVILSLQIVYLSKSTTKIELIFFIISSFSDAI